MSDTTSRVESNRKLLVEAQERGSGATLGAYVKLSGPGWLQSAITLGGGSLAGALFLGVLGGTSLLWLQLVAIVMGVVMLSAISYVTLSTGERPFRAINAHINPVLGWGWLIATCMANMIWCMPQFSLCYAALQKNLVGPETIGESNSAKFSVSAVVLVAAMVVVLLNGRQGLAAKIFDWFLKALVGMIVICFFGVVVYLSTNGLLDWGKILAGFVPDLRQWSQPTGDVAGLVSGLPASLQEFWTERIVKEQRAVMIGAAATAVGINMTFLLPYSMLNRGWDKPFRGLARFDLSTGMAIPYVLVTTCVVIASAASFHAKVDDNFRSTDPAVMQQSPFFAKGSAVLAARLEHELGTDFTSLSDDSKLVQIAALPEAEKQIASSLVKRNAFQLSESLAPLLGQDRANLVFGLGVFGMGFSSIIILMLINGYAFSEMLGQRQGGAAHVVGCLVAGVVGAIWPRVWGGETQFWLAILASSFGMMLLPIAYFTFFMMMNSDALLGKERPTGGRMLVWNVLMGVSVLGAIVAAGSAIWTKVAPIFKDNATQNEWLGGLVVSGVAIVYILLVMVGFAMKSKKPAPTDAESSS
jgi:Mn2+/Fe2+ NRAMP family transporter